MILKAQQMRPKISFTDVGARARVGTRLHWKYFEFVEIFEISWKDIWNILIYFEIFCAKAGVKRPQDEITSTLRWHLGEHPCTLTTFHTKNSHPPFFWKYKYNWWEWAFFQWASQYVNLFGVFRTVGIKVKSKSKLSFEFLSIQLSPPWLTIWLSGPQASSGPSTLTNDSSWYFHFKITNSGIHTKIHSQPNGKQWQT